MAGFEKVDSDDFEYGDVISEEVATSLKSNIDLLSFSVPLGEIVPIMTNIPGVPTPDPNYWQECNGSSISNPNSPLRSVGGNVRVTPNLVGKYIKVPLIFGLSGVHGGSNDSVYFQHDHGGITGTWEAPEDGDPSNDEFRTSTEHAHRINSDFNFAINLEPPFYTVKWYMRIQ